MCGIFAYIGKKDALKTCLQGLKHLEYRGYDSAGLAFLENEKVKSIKTVGNIASLEKKIRLNDLKLNLSIGHTRWATHGPANKENAHPHLDNNSSLALVHNGIIENFDLLKEELVDKGIVFKSETDSEVIAQLISYNYKGNILDSVLNSLKRLKGSLAIALIHKDYPHQIIAACRESPISIGFDDKREEILISSDPNAFLGRDLNVLFLQNDEVVIASPTSINLFNKNGQSIKKKIERFNYKTLTPSKEGFEHFMLKEIFEQPQTIQKAILGRDKEEKGTALFENLNFSLKELKRTKRILIIACGTSWHAGCIAAAMLEDMARIPTQVEIASELRFKNPIISNNTLVLAISQSGETADTIGALREVKAKGAKILAICNVKNSTLTREADSCIFLKAGPEFSVCSTKAFTSQLAVLSLFSLFMARLSHQMKKQQGQFFLKELKKMPDLIKKILNKTEELKKLASKYSIFENFFFLGRRYMHPTCLEAALKLKEISYLNANGYPAGEMKHGPLALINNKSPVIAFCGNRQSYSKMLGNVLEVKSRGAPVLAFALEGASNIEKIADDVFYLPSTLDILAPFPFSIVGQLFAYFIAKKRNREIDQPRNLAKSVTVE